MIHSFAGAKLAYSAYVIVRGNVHPLINTLFKAPISNFSRNQSTECLAPVNTLTTGDQGITTTTQSTKESLSMTVISQELSNIYFVLKSSVSGNTDTLKLL